jgi:uncharacterized protein (TIGR00369 family)
VNLNEESADRLTGLQQLQAMLDSAQQPAMALTMGFQLVEIRSGFAAFEGRPDRSVYNPIGGVHGGYAATLLDSACGCAVHSRLDADQAYTTLELKIAYHRGMTEASGTVRAEGSIVSIGRRVGFAEARLVDGEGRLCATATSTLLIFDRQAPKS